MVWFRAGWKTYPMAIHLSPWSCHNRGDDCCFRRRILVSRISGMSLRRCQSLLLSGLVFAALAGMLVPFVRAQPPVAGREPKFTAEQIEFFEKQVQPILEDNCNRCHGAGRRVGGRLNLTTRAGIVKGGVQ